MGAMSKTKGKIGEREVAALLKKHGFEARRGQQYAGGGDSPDVVHSMDGFHIEVKRSETLALYAALEQAYEDKAEDETALVFHRRNGKRWVVLMDADDFLSLMTRYVYTGEANGNATDQ
jgi:Holliday junction resolvase